MKESARRGELVAVIGSGISIGLTDNKIPALSWKGLIQDGFAFGKKKASIRADQVTAWQAQLNSGDLDDLFGAAEFVSRRLGAPHGNLYARWLQSVFKAVQPANPKLENALRALHAAGIPLCTLNYDPLLERVTGLPRPHHGGNCQGRRLDAARFRGHPSPSWLLGRARHVHSRHSRL